jgi:hypothetical protein
MSAAAQAEIDAVGISLPEYWVALPTSRADFDRTVGGFRRRWRDDGLSRIDQRRCELMLQRVRRQLVDGGVQFAGAAFEQGLRPGVEDTPQNTEALVAVCTFSVLSNLDLQTDVRLSIPVLYSAFAKRGPDNELAKITDLEPAEVCALPAGRAVRLRRLYQLTEPQRRLERWYAETYVLPVGAQGDAAGVLQFCTTNVGLAGEFSGLFASYAETLTFFGPDDPTEMNTSPEDD